MVASGEQSSPLLEQLVEIYVEIHGMVGSKQESNGESVHGQNVESSKDIPRQ